MVRESYENFRCSPEKCRKREIVWHRSGSAHICTALECNLMSVDVDSLANKSKVILLMWTSVARNEVKNILVIQ